MPEPYTIMQKQKRKSDRKRRRRRRLRLRRRHDQRVPSLPNDLIAEILARVPYRSLCRFKCVSRSWLALCSDPRVRSRCPQTLSGFFFNRSRYDCGYVRASRRCAPVVDPFLSFLPTGHTHANFADSCNGLLLCDRRNAHGRVRYRYFVCNPTTEKWMKLPDIEPMRRSYPVVRLGFDPAVSSHFRVFLVVHDDAPVDSADYSHGGVMGVQIYSSETKRWTYRASQWGKDAAVRDDSRSAFFNGALHLTTLDSSSSIVTVDTDGKAWRKIPTPRNFDFIGTSQGQLCAVHRDSAQNDYRLSIWALEDYGRKNNWILKHAVSALEMFGAKEFYMVHAIHPEHDLIFVTAKAETERTLRSYDADSKKVDTICGLGKHSTRAYPYIPCFSKCPLDGH